MHVNRRWTTYPLALIGAILAAIVLVTVSAEGTTSSSGRLGGDFVEFYGAGQIVADGDAADLYEPARQEQAQEGLFGDDDSGGGILFAYPAVLAAPYAAIQALGYSVGYLLHTAVMLGAVALSVRLLRGRLPILAERHHLLAAGAYSLTFLPMFIGVTGGQTTALTLLALATVWWGLDTDRHELAGLAAGLLLIKPQYGAGIIGLLILGRYWRAVAGALGGAAVVWIGSALVAGVGWTSDWLDLASRIAEIDGGANLPNEVSWLGLAELALGRGGAATTVSLVLTAATGLVVLACLKRRPRLDALTVALIIPTMLLAAPHALFYDAGLLLVPLGALIFAVPSHRRLRVLALFWLAGLGHLGADALGFEPVALLVIATWAWAVHTIWTELPESRGPIDDQRVVPPRRSAPASISEEHRATDQDPEQTRRRGPVAGPFVGTEGALRGSAGV